MNKITNQQEKNIKTIIVKTTERTFISVAEAFSVLGCGSRIYEPKMPDALKK